MSESPVRGIDHVAILVRDIDASIPYYVEVLGMTVTEEDQNTSAAARLVYLNAGNMTVQLVSPFGPGAIADALASRGEGLHHICFTVDDIPEALEHLAPAHPVSVSIGGRNRRTAFLPDRPNGLIMELTEIEETAT